MLHLFAKISGPLLHEIYFSGVERCFGVGGLQGHVFVV